MVTIDALTREAAGIFIERARKTFPIHSALLFGSRARNEGRNDSDADLAIFLSGDPASFVQTKLALADIAYDVLLEKGVLVQPLPIWDEEWRRPELYPNPQLLANIKRDGVAI
jgi:antitoxin ChpS